MIESIEFRNRRGTLTFQYIDDDGDLEVEMEVNDYYSSIYLTREQVQKVIAHLQKQLAEPNTVKSGEDESNTATKPKEN